MFEKIKKRLDNWIKREQMELDNFVCGKMREQIKKDCPELFDKEK